MCHEELIMPKRSLWSLSSTTGRWSANGSVCLWLIVEACDILYQFWLQEELETRSYHKSPGTDEDKNVSQEGRIWSNPNKNSGYQRFPGSKYWTPIYIVTHCWISGTLPDSALWISSFCSFFYILSLWQMWLLSIRFNIGFSEFWVSLVNGCGRICRQLVWRGSCLGDTNLWLH